MATLTVNPSASAIDENIVNTTSASFSTLRGKPSGSAAKGSTFPNNNVPLCGIRADGTQYNGLWRSIFQFDTSALGSSANISAATLSLYGSIANNPPGVSPAINLYSASPASTTNATNTDFAALGTTAYSSSIAVGSWANGSYNAFALNSTGIAAINKTGVTAIGAREANYDATGTDPGFGGTGLQTLIEGSYSGATNKPKLVITYTLSTPSLMPFFMSA